MITIFDIGSGAVLDQTEPTALGETQVSPTSEHPVDLVNQDPALQIVPVQPELHRETSMPPDLARTPVSPFVDRQPSVHRQR